MARPVLPLLSGIVAFLLPWAVADTVPPRCSRPKDVANAHIDAGNDAVLHTLLRYTCNPGYKRKAGTSSLIQCILRDGSAEPEWTHTTLQCIRTTDVSRNSSPLPAATSGPLDAASQSPVPPAPDGPSPETAMPPEMSPPLDASTPGEGMALGTTMVPAAPADRATGLPVLVVAGVVACCCWRRKRRTGQDYVQTVTAIPMVAPAAENEEILLPGIFPTG
ncbi:uncharacterized protein VSU04_012531 isoform 3-T4 [Chlamydotis macqueenii]